MKKVLTTLALAILANNTFAAAEKSTNQAIPFEGKPAVVLQIFDTSGKVAKPIKGNTMSLSKKQNRLCWVSFNVPLTAQVTVAEAFYAPGVAKVASEGSHIDASSDNTSHTIVTKLSGVSTQNISRCWDFDKNDPLGKYRMEVQVNDQVFKGLNFELVK